MKLLGSTPKVCILPSVKEEKPFKDKIICKVLSNDDLFEVGLGKTRNEEIVHLPVSAPITPKNTQGAKLLFTKA